MVSLVAPDREVENGEGKTNKIMEKAFHGGLVFA